MIITNASAQFATEPDIIFDKLLPGKDLWKVDSSDSPIHYLAYRRNGDSLFLPRYEEGEKIFQQQRFGENTALAQVSVLALVPEKQLVLKTNAKVYGRSEIVLRSTYALQYRPGQDIDKVDRTKYLDWEGNVLDEETLQKLLGPITTLNLISVLTIPNSVLPRKLDEELLFNITEKSETIEKSFKALGDMCKISPPEHFHYKTTAIHVAKNFKTKNKSKP